MNDLIRCEAHGRIFDERVPIGAQCQECDWCPKCDEVRQYDSEVCVTCGRVWGDES